MGFVLANLRKSVRLKSPFSNKDCKLQEMLSGFNCETCAVINVRVPISQGCIVVLCSTLHQSQSTSV